MNGLRTLFVFGLLLTLVLDNTLVGMSHCSPLEDIKRQAADFIAAFVLDENRIVPVPQIGPIVEQSVRDEIGGIHRFNVARKLGRALVDDDFRVPQLKMI
jgi:hypothetical protein